MDPSNVIFDISSDEDVGWEEPNDDHLSWFSELFNTVDKENEESDEVVVLREVSGTTMQRHSYKPMDSVKSAAVMDGLDDDCLILDGDPDKPVSVVNDTDNGSDELLIVSEKGQLACRDYPHSRHQCAKFDFSTTPHEKYCDLCHCYVCDSRAPCNYWGTGASSSDHCHSTDKEEVWRSQRNWFREGKTAPPPSCKVPEINLPMPPSLRKSGPAHVFSESLNCSSVPLHSPPKSNPLHACSSTTSFGVPSIISHRNNQLSGFTLGRNRLPHQASRSQLIRATNNNTRRIRSGVGGSLGPHFVSPQSNFKRIGSPGGVLMKNQYEYDSSSDNNHLHMSQTQRNRCPPVIHHGGINSRSHQDFFAASGTEPSTCRSSSQPDISSSFVDLQSYTISSQPQVHSQPIPRSIENQSMYSHNSPAPNATNPTSLDFDLSWLNDTTQSLIPTTENSQLPSVQPSSELSPVTEPVPPCLGDTNPALTDFDLDGWFHALEHHPVPETAEDTMPPALDFVSNQAELVNPEMLLFDFENS